jgi:hypothetical protein
MVLTCATLACPWMMPIKVLKLIEPQFSNFILFFGSQLVNDLHFKSNILLIFVMHLVLDFQSFLTILSVGNVKKPPKRLMELKGQMSFTPTMQSWPLRKRGQ